MPTIVILSDILTHDDQNVKKIKVLFPDCNIQIFRKTVPESSLSDIGFNLKGNSHQYNLNNQKIKPADLF